VGLVQAKESRLVLVYQLCRQGQRAFEVTRQFLFTGFGAESLQFRCGVTQALGVVDRLPPLEREGVWCEPNGRQGVRVVNLERHGCGLQELGGSLIRPRLNCPQGCFHVVGIANPLIGFPKPRHGRRD